MVEVAVRGGLRESQQGFGMIQKGEQGLPEGQVDYPGRKARGRPSGLGISSVPAVVRLLTFL